MADVDKTRSKVLQVLEIKQRLEKRSINSSRHRIAALEAEINHLREAPRAAERELVLNLCSSDWPLAKARRLKALNEQIAREMLAELDAVAMLGRYQAQAEAVAHYLEVSRRKAFRRHQRLRLESMINERLCAPNGSTH